LLLGIAVFALLAVRGIRWSGRRLIQLGLSDDDRLFLAVLLALFLASLGAELAGVRKIVGAFLAGLAVNPILLEGKVKEQVIFVGGVLFINHLFHSPRPLVGSWLPARHLRQLLSSPSPCWWAP